MAPLHSPGTPPPHSAPVTLNPTARILFHGPFGADQTTRARDIVCEMADAGARDILYVVPNAGTRRGVISDLVGRRGAIFGVRVVSIGKLPREIERRARVRGAPIIRPVLDEILAERALRYAVKTPDDAVPVSGLATAAIRTIAHLERAGASHATLATALGPHVNDGARVLLEMWAQMDALRSSRTRTTDQTVLAATALAHERQATILDSCALVVLENLPLHQARDRALVAALLAAAHCPVIAVSEYAAQLGAAPATRAHAALCTLADWDSTACKPVADPLQGAGTRLFGVAGEEHDLPAPRITITRLECAGDVGEVRLAARVIRRHLRGATGAHPINAADVLVVVPPGSRYRTLIREIFAEHRIPIALHSTRSAADTALGSVLLELLELATSTHTGTRERALQLIRTPLADIGMHAADRLERSVMTRGYLGLDGWDALATRALSRRATNRVNRLKRAVESARESLASARSCDTVAHAVRHLVKQLRLVGNSYVARHRMTRAHRADDLAIALRDVAVREDNRTWEIIEQVLDDAMPELVRAARLELSETRGTFAGGWLALFRRALASESLGVGRPVADAVRVVGIGSGDGQSARVTIILGLQQKILPRQPRQDPFLPDHLLNRLAGRGIHVATSEDVTERERESFARAVATARDALYLSSPSTDAEGKPTVASFFLDDFQRAVGIEHRFAVECLGVADVVPEPEDAASRAELLASVSHGVWQRLPPTTEATADRAAAFAAWNELAAVKDGPTAAVRGRIPATRPVLDRQLFSGTPYATLELSASQLRAIGHCTFEHFVQKVLHPEELSAPQYDALEKGSLIHLAMMEWVRLDGWRRGEEALPQLERWFANRTDRLSPAAHESAFARHMMEEDRVRLLAFIEEELSRMHTPDAAHPQYNELAFGTRAAATGDRDPASLATTFDMSVPTSAGERIVHFNGSIDRVDVYEDDGPHGIALDYKAGKSSSYYAKSMADGTDLQLRLYLLALHALWNIKPVGALYLGFGDGVRRGIICENAEDRVGKFDIRHVRVLSRDDWNTFVYDETPQLIQPLIERLVALDIVASPRKGDCGFCDLGSICRYGEHDRIAANV